VTLTVTDYKRISPDTGCCHCCVSGWGLSTFGQVTQFSAGARHVQQRVCVCVC